MMLIVVAKAKALIKEKAEMNTSKEATDNLSAYVEKVLIEAIELAKKDGRKTVMGRDVQTILNGGV